MREIFIQCMNQSIIISWVIIFIMILRLLMKKMPKWIKPYLWIYVMVRFIIPSSFTNNFSIIPSANSFPISNLYGNRIKVSSGVKLIDRFFNDNIFENYFTGVSVDYRATADFFAMISILWLTVMGIFIGLFIWHNITLYLRLKEAVRISKNVYKSNCIKNSFVFGVICPRIYLPYGLSIKEENYIIEHEKTHIKRKDHILKIVYYFFLTINCFNPLVWISYYMLSKDIELACDESIMKNKNVKERKEYAKVLYSESTGCVDAFFNTSFNSCFLKTRIKNVVNYNQISLLYIGIVVFVCFVVLVLSIGNPGQNNLFW